MKSQGGDQSTAELGVVPQLVGRGGGQGCPPPPISRSRLWHSRKFPRSGQSRRGLVRLGRRCLGWKNASETMKWQRSGCPQRRGGSAASRTQERSKPEAVAPRGHLAHWLCEQPSAFRWLFSYQSETRGLAGSRGLPARTAPVLGQQKEPAPQAHQQHRCLLCYLLATKAVFRCSSTEV